MAGNKREAATAEYLEARLTQMISTGAGCASFDMDKEKDAKVKEAIRLYVLSWMLPQANALAASLRGDADPEQLATLDRTADDMARHR